MTEWQPAPRDPHLETVAQWQSVGGPPDTSGVTGRPIGATTGPRDLTGSGRPEGD